MKPVAVTVIALALVPALVPGLAQAYKPNGASEMTEIGGISVLLGSAIVIASPFIVVGDVIDASTKDNRVQVRAKTDQGKPETLELPKEAVAEAKLEPGDKLTVKPAKSRAVLAKNDMPTAFLVTPENAKLSHSHELAR